MKKLSKTSRFVIIVVFATVAVILLLLTIYRLSGITSQFIPINDIKLLVGYYDDDYVYDVADENDYVVDEYYYEEESFGETETVTEEITVPESTTAPHDIYWVVTEGDDLNLREFPSTDSAVLARIPYSTEIVVIGYDGEWAKTEYNGIVGYVSMDYIVEVA
ncbi:MAG: SH3 domain-containing protein [Clostridia bacterium]|nr:SH3 domain-containing protein [Clostridia bacterium]